MCRSCRCLLPRVAAKQVNLFAHRRHRVRVPGLGRCAAAHVRADPGHRVEVENVNVVEALDAVIPAEHVELAPDARERVAGARRRRLARDGRQVPPARVRVERVEVLQPRDAVVPAVHEELDAHHRDAVVVARRRPVAREVAQRPRHGVKVEHVEVVERLGVMERGDFK